MVLIAVHGTASRSVPAERGEVRLEVRAEAGTAAEAVRAAAALHERLAGEAGAFLEAGAATAWSSSDVRTSREHRYDDLDERGRTVQTASAEVRATFQDLDALGRWLVEVGSTEGVAVAGLDWTLTAERREQVEREVRLEAVRDALRRASAYAEAIGGSGPVLEAVWEAGLRPTGGGEGSDRPRYRWTAQSGEPEELRLHPADLEVAAGVTADFTVDAG